MEKFSVKKPFTILVAAIIIIAMGAVSLTHLSMDLLPEIDLPYLIVITAYPGASPEKVEEIVTKPVESSLGTINGVKNISSSSSEGMSMVQMEFEDGTDMNAAMVRVSGALNMLEGTLPDDVMTPNIMEISLDMFATMYVAVEKDDCDIYELTDFVNYEVVPNISRQNGVASITTLGLVEKSVQVELNQDKIDALNDKILTETDSRLADAQAQLDEANEALEDARTELEDAQSSFGSTMSSALFSQFDGQAGDIADQMKDGLEDLADRLEDLRDGIGDYEDAAGDVMSAAQDTMDDAQALLASAQETQAQLQTVLEDAQALFEEAQQALEETDPESENYQELLDNYTRAQEELLAAQQAYDERSEELLAAQAAYDQAAAELAAAVSDFSFVSDGQTEELREEITALIESINSAADDIDGSSVTSLINSTRELMSLFAQTTSAMSAAGSYDSTGSLDDVLDNLEDSLDSASDTADSIPAILTGLQTATGQITQGQLDAAVAFSTASVKLADAQAQLDAAQARYDDARQTALDNANMDQFVTAETLSQIIYAQNFSMPIGYIDDENDESWLLRVGEEYGNTEDIASTLLIDNEIIGTVRLEDIADISVIDNAGESYTKVNGQDAIVLCIYKSSSAGTNDVSKRCNKAFEDMKKEYPDLNTINLVDQGVYISMIVESVFQSIIIGAILAVVILALFLKDVKPTIVVAISIPLSVLLAIVLMYFTGLELNMMTLSGLSLGIGMLVDNSVVVMENIFRLRGRGMPAPRAAVQGAKQVRGSIIASTLTTICVFFPAVFASGTVKSLLYPLALSVGYCLVASLGIAMTVVPASCSTIMKNTKPKEHKLFDKMLKVYEKTLLFCLRFKVVPLTISIVLLAFSVIEVFRMGIVYIPEITTNEISINITTPEDMTREESYAAIDDCLLRILEVDGIEYIGAMDSESTSAFFMAGTGDGSYGSYVCNALATEGASAQEIDRIAKDINESLADSPCTVEVSTGSGMGDMSAMMGSSGISVNIYGNDYEELRRISADITEIMENQEGLTGISDSFAGGEPTLQVIIDRDEAMRYGFTVAQIFAEIASHTSTTTTATTITVDGVEMKVNITDNTDTLTREDLLNLEFEEIDMMAQTDMGSGEDMSFEGFDTTEMYDEDSSDETETSETEETEEEEEESKIHTLSEFAEVIETTSSDSINRSNLVRYVTVSSEMSEGYNATLIARELSPKLDEYSKSLPGGYSVEISGESSEVMEMVKQMLEMAALALLFIYLIMVAQFQSLLSPLIILFTIPLAFTGGMIGLLIADIPLSLLSLLGFVVLMGTVVNNGIVFVDYTNQLRIGGLERRDALVATGITRMRPILMTALTTILAMSMMIFGSGMASQLGRGMAVVISAGLLYSTFMTLFIVPVMYDILFKKQPLNVDVGSDIDDAIDDAAEYLATHNRQN